MQQSVRVVALLCVLAFSSSLGFAGQPSIQYLDIPVGTTVTVTGVCPFNVLEVATANDEKIATFFNQAGQITFQLVTGVNKWLFTNVSTGKTLELEASGPAKFTVQPGTNSVLSVSGGVSFFTITNPPPGIPKFPLTRGRVVAQLDPATFTITNFISLDGTVQDICALLQ